MDYVVVTNLSTQDHTYQVALLLHTLCDNALRIYNRFHLETNEDKRAMDEVLAKFKEFTVGEVNKTYERFLFNESCKHVSESFESFLTAILSLMKTCNHCATCINSILSHRIVWGISDSDITMQLLKERKLTLEECIVICKAAENAVKGHALRDSDKSKSEHKLNTETNPNMCLDTVIALVVKLNKTKLVCSVVNCML